VVILWCLVPGCAAAVAGLALAAAAVRPGAALSLLASPAFVAQQARALAAWRRARA
jgi:hypothetical protein